MGVGNVLVGFIPASTFDASLQDLEFFIIIARNDAEIDCRVG
jgi:hypothetical protein